MACPHALLSLSWANGMMCMMCAEWLCDPSPCMSGLDASHPPLGLLDRACTQAKPVSPFEGRVAHHTLIHAASMGAAQH